MMKWTICRGGRAQQNSVLQNMHKQGTHVGTTMNTKGEANKLEGLTLCEDKATACANLLEPVFCKLLDRVMHNDDKRY